MMAVVGGSRVDKRSSRKGMWSHRNLDRLRSGSLWFDPGKAFYDSSPLKNHGEREA